MLPAVTKIDSTAISAIADDDAFGSSLAAGDVDGDGIRDLIVGSPLKNGQEGEVRVLYLNTDGSVREEFAFDDPGSTGNVQFGASVLLLDSTPTHSVIAVGAPGDDFGLGSNVGEVHLVQITKSQPFSISAREALVEDGIIGEFGRDQLGGTSLAAGDVDGDGVNELHIGVPGTGTFTSESALISYEFTSAFPFTLGAVPNRRILSYPSQFGGELTGSVTDFAGASVLTVPGLSASGGRSLLLGASRDDGPADVTNESGAVFVTSVDPTFAIDDFLDTDDIADIGSQDRFGRSMATFETNPDLDSDGNLDVFIGAPLDDNATTINRGVVYILGMNSSGLQTTTRIDGTEAPFGSLLSNQDEFGDAIAVLGDLDGDNTIEVAIGAPSDDTGGSDRGAVYLVSLAATSPGVNITESAGNTTVTEGGATDSFDVVLDAQPQADVTIDLTFTAGDITLSTAQLTFSATNPGNRWDIPQTVTVSAVDDSLIEATEPVSVNVAVTSADAGYAGLAVSPVTVTVLDNDVAGIIVTESGGSSVVSEPDTTDSFTVRLAAQPGGTVTLDVTQSGHR